MQLIEYEGSKYQATGLMIYEYDDVNMCSKLGSFCTLLK